MRTNTSINTMICFYMSTNSTQCKEKSVHTPRQPASSSQKRERIAKRRSENAERPYTP